MEKSAYDLGVQAAEEVQQGLREGRTFAEMCEMEPLHAAHVRDIALGYLQEEPGAANHKWFYEYYDGYVSKWD